ncbi:MAG: PIN domain nuclease, partial [Candidatus Omnitrophica bacterium]|nr:PIN domain nuclease [Candidatus Omnitrophota bacterium]
MILVDTSVWIQFFNEAHDAKAFHLRDLIGRGADLALSDFILTEILQGIFEETRFESTRTYLLDFPIFRARDLNTYIHAAQLYRRCLRAGVTVRKTIDSLIAAVAIEHGLELFHNDRDFD